MDLQQCLTRVRMDGFCVVEGVLPEGDVEGVRQCVEHATERHGRDQARAKGIGHVPGFIRYDASLAPYLAQPDLLQLIEALLGPEVRVSFATATINYPGNERGGWHADSLPVGMLCRWIRKLPQRPKPNQRIVQKARPDGGFRLIRLAF